MCVEMCENGWMCGDVEGRWRCVEMVENVWRCVAMCGMC